ncbi:1568_t:CDS:2, partial [Gigaspora margarita]
NTVPGDYGARVMSTLRLPSGVLYKVHGEEPGGMDSFVNVPEALEFGE